MSQPPAVRHARGAATLARALAALAAVALAAPAALAQTTTLTFNGLTDATGAGVRYVNNCYEEAGMRVTLVGFACGTEAALATWTPDSPLYYSGSPALYNNLGASVDFTAVSGTTFSFQSIGLTSFLGQFGNATSVMFTGFLNSGGSVMRTVAVPGGMLGQPAMMSPFAFTGFDNLSSLRLTVMAPAFEPYVQFDNVAFAVGSTAVIPEPATVVLFGVGLAGLGAAARRRRATTR